MSNSEKDNFENADYASLMNYSRENLVMTLAYDRASVLTDSGGEGGASRDIPHGHPYGKLKNAIFPWRVFV